MWLPSQQFKNALDQSPVALPPPQVEENPPNDERLRRTVHNREFVALPPRRTPSISLAQRILRRSTIQALLIASGVESNPGPMTLAERTLLHIRTLLTSLENVINDAKQTPAEPSNNAKAQVPKSTPPTHWIFNPQCVHPGFDKLPLWVSKTDSDSAAARCLKNIYTDFYTKQIDCQTFFDRIAKMSKRYPNCVPLAALAGKTKQAAHLNVRQAIAFLNDPTLCKPSMSSPTPESAPTTSTSSPRARPHSPDPRPQGGNDVSRKDPPVVVNVNTEEIERQKRAVGDLTSTLHTRNSTIAELQATRNSLESQLKDVKKAHAQELKATATMHAKALKEITDARAKMLKEASDAKDAIAKELASIKATRTPLSPSLQTNLDEQSLHLMELRIAEDGHDKDLADAKAKYEKALADAKAEHEKALADAKAEHEKALADAKAEHEKALVDAKTEHADAKAEHVKALADAGQCVMPQTQGRSSTALNLSWHRPGTQTNPMSHKSPC